MTTHPAPARRGAHLVFQRRPAAVAQPPAAPPAEPPPPAAAAAPKATPKPKRTHRVEPRPAPGWAAWLAGWLLWAGGALAVAMLWIVGTALTFITDGPQSWHGLNVLNIILGTRDGSPPMGAEWQLWIAFIVVFCLSNGFQWLVAFKWDRWVGSPLGTLKLALTLVPTILFTIPHLLLATIGGYDFIEAAPATLDAVNVPLAIFWGAWSFVFSVVVQGVGTYMLHGAARPAGKEKRK